MASGWLRGMGGAVIAFTALFAAVAAAAAPAWPAVAESRSEVEAEAAVAALDLADIRLLHFSEIERFIRLGWWRASRALVARSHEVRVDLTAPARRATSDMKQSADMLLKWLDPRYAHPAATPMSMRWAQNTSAVFLAARFAARWEAPGANLAVFSTQRGRGHVDINRTRELVESLLMVNISQGYVRAEIIAEAANVRKRFTLYVDLFDEVVPERSSWTVAFQRAQGSMQMSSGVQIPELHFELRKRSPGPRRWSQMTARVGDREAQPDPLVNPPWWAEAPGISKSEMELLRGEALEATAPVCAAGGALLCAAAGACVEACLDCRGATWRHSSSPRCIGPVFADPVEFRFVDTDLRQGLVGGSFLWHPTRQSDDAFVESIALHWGKTASQRFRDDLPPIAALAASYGDLVREIEVPSGSIPPSTAEFVLLIASNEAGEAIVAHSRLADRCQPPPPSSFAFVDTDLAKGRVAGIAEVWPCADESAVEAYELRWARAAIHGAAIPALVLDSESVLARVDRGALEVGDDTPWLLPINGSVDVPAQANLLVVFSIGRGDVRSDPLILALVDADLGPPSSAPRRIAVSRDDNPVGGVVSFVASITPASCAPATAKAGVLCDPGDSYAIYWALENGSKIDVEIASFPSSTLEYSFVDARVPREACALVVLARNDHGEIADGPSIRFVDNRSEDMEIWKDTQVLAVGADDSLKLWKPFGLEREPRVVGADVRDRMRITAVALDARASYAVFGREDGSVSLLDLIADQVVRTVQGRGGVTALALCGQSWLMVRGSRSGLLDVWDLGAEPAGGSAAVAHLRGHTDAIEALDLDCEGGHLASASRDGTVRLWNLAPSGGGEGTCTATHFVHETGASALSVDWASGARMLVGSPDESVRLLDAASGKHLRTFEGHGEPVRLIAADWVAMRALSAADDRSVRGWDLRSGECTLSFVAADRVLAIEAKWLSSPSGGLATVAGNVTTALGRALAVLLNGSAAAWDLDLGTFGDLRHADAGALSLGHTARLVSVAYGRAATVA